MFRGSASLNIGRMDTFASKNGNRISINRDNGEKRFVQPLEIALTHLLKGKELSRLITNKVRHQLRDRLCSVGECAALVARSLRK